MRIFRWFGLIAFVAAWIAAAPSAAHARPAESRTAMMATRPDSDAKPLGSLEQPISLTMRDARLDVVLSEIARQTGIRLVYNDRIVPVDKLVSVNRAHATVREILRMVLVGTGVTFRTTTSGTVLLTRESGTDSTTTLGVIVGRVLDSASKRGVSNVTVRVVGTKLAAVTTVNGEYVLTTVPIGARTITVRLLGYVVQQRQVTVAANQSVTANFTLRPAATVLSGVVTTATGERRRIEVGNDITTLDVPKIMEQEQIRTVTDLLANRVPGTLVTRSSGNVGAPARIRIRGISSASLNNDPIVILNGIRIQGPTIGDTIEKAPITSRLDDIDPNSIERIEILKGPSASTLYGTDAANGVIVITTKRGSPGPLRWTANYSRAWDEVQKQFPLTYVSFGHSLSSNNSIPCSDAAYVFGVCTVQDSVVGFNAQLNPNLRTIAQGFMHSGSLGMNFGTSVMQMSANGSFTDGLGASKVNNYTQMRYQTARNSTLPDWFIRPNTQSSKSGSLNLSAQPSPTTSVGVMVMGSHSSTGSASTDGTDPGIIAANASTILDSADLGRIGLIDRITQTVDHVSLGLTPSWTPASRGAVRLAVNTTVGVDYAASAGSLWQIADYCLDNCGGSTDAQTSQTNSPTYSASWRASLDWAASNQFSLRTAVGQQYTRSRVTGSSVRGSGLPAGATDLSRATTTSGEQIQTENATAGWYIEETASWRDRLFGSVAVRQDVGSTFGNDISAPLYPKFSLSWVAIKSAPRTPVLSAISSFRPRLSYGHSAVQPPLTASLAQYETVVSYVDGVQRTGLVMTTVGNSKLEPERSAEIEGGFDLGLFSDRITFTGTMFRKRSSQAIINNPLAASAGVSGTSRIENVGVVVNQGTEITASIRALDNNILSWDMSVGGSGTRNKLLTLGPNVSSFGNTNARIAVGYPLFSSWYFPLVGYADADGNGQLTSDEVILGNVEAYAGWPQPKYSAFYSSNVAFLNGRLRFNTDFSFQNGVPQTQALQNQRGQVDRNAPLDVQADYIRQFASNMNQRISRTSLLRWNNLSVNYTLPIALTRLARAQSGRVMLSCSNLRLWTQYEGDPGVNTALRSERIADGGAIPLPRSWNLNFGFNF